MLQQRHVTTTLSLLVVIISVRVQKGEQPGYENIKRVCVLCEDPSVHRFSQHSEEVAFMVLYVQNHPAEPSSLCAIRCGPPSVDCNTALMIERDDGPFHSCPKL